MADKEKSYLSKKLYEFRTQNKLMQFQVAELLGITRSSYSYYEIGKTSPSPEKLNMLAKIYGVNIEDFFEPEKQANILYDPSFSDSPADNPIAMAELSKEERMLIARYRLAKTKDKKKAVNLLEKSTSPKDSQQN